MSSRLDEPLLPSQVGRRGPAPTGDRFLWAAVVSEALECVQAGPDRVWPTRHGSKAVYQDAVDWFFNDALRGIGSFIWCATLLDLDVESVRVQVRAIIDAKMALRRRPGYRKRQ